MEPKQEVTVGDLPGALASQGRYVASQEEIRYLTGGSEAAVASGLHRLRASGQLLSPARGLHVVISPEYRTWKAVPADWFIDDLMRHLGRRYYVGLLSAAAVHGAAHQAPQSFQVITDRRVLDRDFGRVRLRFYTSEHLDHAPTTTYNSRTGTVIVSTPETTVVDLVARPRAGGGLSNVATVIKEIGELNGSVLADYAARHGHTIARRVGWMVDNFGQVEDLNPLRLAARLDQGEPAPLVPGRRRRGRTDRDWQVRVNTTVEPDV